MNRSALIVLGLIAVCLGVGWGIMARHRQPGVPQTQEGQVLTQLSEPLDAQLALTSTRHESVPPEVSSEPLRLGSEMRRMLERERELAGTPEENERFWKQFALQCASAPVPPPEFIRKSEAQWVGTGNPEDTFESVLWSLHHRRLDAFLQLLAPDTAERLRKRIGNAPEKFFDASDAISAMRLSDQRFHGAAAIKAQLDLGPDDPDPKTIFFFLLDGQWKMVLDADARFTP